MFHVREKESKREDLELVRVFCFWDGTPQFWLWKTFFLGVWAFRPIIVLARLFGCNMF